ncbi:tail tape measure protein [Pseudomonas panacis]|uniref:tail tape measure protein n=1 Tax=Pseudomonas marginalis TaxID=298 RepID=UPI001474E783|nr:tail tape measure protein [Pseudomonas marginalis]NMZ94130.1 tail tape measure protein [Pseudomonas marginalis]
MQETQFETRLVQEDKRWLFGEADLGNVLTPFTAGLATPVRLDAAPQLQPQAELTSALISVSVDVNALMLEQVRLRETLETLNSTLFINGHSLAIKTVDVAAGAAEGGQKEPTPPNDSWVDKGLKAGTDLAKDLGSSVWDTVKTRVAGNVVDVTLGKLPGVGKLFKDGGVDKDKDKDKQCCPGTTSLGAASLIDPASARLPGGIGETVREKNKARPSSSRKKRRANVPKPVDAIPGSSKLTLDNKVVVPGKSVDLKPPVVAPPLNAMGQPLIPFDIKQAGQASVHLPGNSLASSAAPPVTGPAARGAGKGLAANLSGTLARLESSTIRRLGPMKYVDTAVDVVQGVRNGDANAIGTGLSTAGGAWAGASAGAAIGTLIFPGVGTAVGGAIGGLLGSEAGSWLGDKLFGSTDRLPTPNAVSKELNSARTDNVQVTLAPSIQITGVNPADAQQVVNQVIQALQFQCLPMLTDTLGIRRNAALADPPGGD